jgi:hypothetical protein
MNDHFQNSPGSLLLLSDRESPFLAFLKPNKQRSALLLGVPKRLSELKDILVNEKQVHFRLRQTRKTDSVLLQHN